MSEDEFTRLFKHMNQRFDSIETKLDGKASQTSLDRLTNTVDAFIARIDKMVMRDRQFDRLLDWARKVSKKTGVPLENL